MDSNHIPVNLVLEDRYELLERIGEGGMAMVYKALDRRLNRYVAVKIMRPEMSQDEEVRQRFFAESHAVARLSSPNIVAVYDVSHTAEIEYIVMELVDGITLRHYLDRKGPIPWREAVYFAKQTARALAHAHQKGVVHRDIKPQNMLLLRDGTLKVGDFGIAALESEIAEESGTAAGRHPEGGGLRHRGAGKPGGGGAGHRRGLHPLYRAGADPGREPGRPQRPLFSGRGDVRDAHRPKAL